MIPVVASPAHEQHDVTTEVAWGLTIDAHERPVRANIIHRALSADDEFSFLAPTDHGIGVIEAVHDPGLVRFLSTAWQRFQQLQPQREVFPDTFVHMAVREGMGPVPEPTQVQAALGYWCFETMTPLLEGTYGAARAAVDIAMTAGDLVRNGEHVAYGLCRPPGHHAPRAAYGGYCYFNNAAVAAHDLAATMGTKVTVLDVDYHHGNGTQQIFYQRDDVQYVSLHGDPNRAYPYVAGFAEETGSGRGLGSTLNVPLPAGTDDDAYERQLAGALEAIDRFDPGVIVVSLGLDTFEGDPIGDLALTPDGFERHGRLVAQLGRPMVILQEGGYAVAALGENVRRWLTGAAAQ